MQPTPVNSSELTHVDESGRAHMVDVGEKAITKRLATACVDVEMSLEAAQAIRDNTLNKGDCIQVARIAAIQAAKQTSNLIPLCHPISISSVHVEHSWKSNTLLEWRVHVGATGQTGVEMEAMTAASVAALTTYDMCKSVDRSIRITNLRLEEKSGGVRGNYIRNEN